MNRKMFVGVVSVLALAVALAGCGGSSSSNPASPSATASTGQSGATISGTVSGATTGSAAGYQKLDSSSGITVTISGTSLTVAVDAQGKFTFTGVSAGTVQLVFTVGGASATLTLTGVQATDKITIHVTVKGTTATLDDEQRNGAAMTELEDQIASINAAARTMVVGGVQVSVPTTAVIRHGDASTAVDFSTLRVGDRVHVRGAMSGSTMTASEVIVQNTNSNPGVNASGTVTAVTSKACPVAEFAVGGWTVVTNASTDFQKITCTGLVVGSSVHIKGTVQQPSGKVLATWVQGK
jgi:hypothetical protein